MQQHATITEATFIHDANQRLARRPRGRPIHRMLVSFSAAYFAGALVTDLVYWQMPDVMWERFSIWLITAGLVMAGLCTVAFGIDLFAPPPIQKKAPHPTGGAPVHGLLSPH